MARLYGIHWLAPASMSGALLVGVLLAVGHHRFYRSLAGTSASGSDYSILGSDISRQQTNIAIGTTFAFVTKAMLVYAAAVAFVQLFWRIATANHATTTLGKLDSLSQATDNVMVLFNIPLWSQHCLLLLLATSTWLIPVASIITPATLSSRVAPVLPVPIHPRFVPRTDFSSVQLLNTMPAYDYFYEPGAVSGPEFSAYVYNGPSPQLLGAVSSAMTSGALLAVPAPSPNASWELDFAGPAIQCLPLAAADRDIVLDNYRSLRGRKTKNSLYMSWYPESTSQSNGTRNSNVPFIASGHDGSMAFSTGTPSGAVRIFMPPFRDANDRIGPIDPAAYNVDGTSLECKLYNATYKLVFDYTNGVQNINTREISVNTSYLVSRHNVQLGPLVTMADDYYFTCPPPEHRSRLRLATIVSEESDAPCFADPVARESLTYHATMDAFSQMLVGSIHFDGNDKVSHNTTALSTALKSNPQLSILSRRMPSLQWMLANQRSPISGVVMSGHTYISKMPLAAALEEMFRNATISLMGSQALQMSNASGTAVNVTLPSLEVIYVYSAWKLWLAYGIAILLATCAVAAGIGIMWISGASYSDNFSTTLRAARGARLGAPLRQEDMDGCDPLPKHLSEATVVLVHPHGESNTVYRPLQKEV